MAKGFSILLRVRWLFMTLALVLVTGCATVDKASEDPRDPWEGFNRTMYNFNDALDKAIFKPLAQGYKAVVPAPVDKGVTNFFGNLADVGSAINNLLQLKVDRAANDIMRVAVNSTFGLLGLIDIASDLNMKKHDEDFGQTLGTWGAGPGPFIVLPLLGPSTGRDTIGLVVDWYTDPVTYVEGDDARWGLQGLRFLDRRADLLTTEKVLDEAALDPYVFVRDAFLQRRQYQVHDGSPPEDSFPE